MNKLIMTVVIAMTFAITAFGQGTPPPYSKLKVGDMAPDFTLRDTKLKTVKLSDFRGKNNVVLAFYIFAFTGG